ncbi:DUF1676 domain-containing protein Osi23 [Rhynchophorus ferrugineus]|uniref:DUF1676 domain-containing protein Osi23 n=1 Tax=Rhynchophorus ferrugineus TaxID=354439 RepID=UPI003FCED93F
MLMLYSVNLWMVSFIISTVSNFIIGNVNCQGTSDRMWSELGRVTGLFLHQCIIDDIEAENNVTHANDNIGFIFQDCFKRKGLQALDRALNRDVIEITKNVLLVRWKNDTDSFSSINRRTRSMNATRSSSLMTSIDWRRKIVNFFKTRLLKIKLRSFSIGNYSKSEARHRRKDSMMSQLMMFGLVAAGFIVIPMGFQFLAVLGGKALLLAKLALLLSSINGLKKIATSQMNYGLYSAGHSGAPCKNYIECYGQVYYNDYALDVAHFPSFPFFGLPRWFYDTTGDGVDFDQGTEENGNDIYFSFDIDTDPSIDSGHYDRHWPHEGGTHVDIGFTHDLALSGPGYSSYHSTLYPREDTVPETSTLVN